MAGKSAKTFNERAFLRKALISQDWIPGYLMKAQINKRIMLFYSLLGTVLFITSGVFIIQSWERAFRTRTRDLAMTKGVVAIINGVIFFMDTIFTFRQKK
jgi:hypothetical protein